MRYQAATVDPRDEEIKNLKWELYSAPAAIRRALPQANR
jgi:hypothetical protein